MFVENFSRLMDSTPANQPLRILHLEDNPADSQLVRDQLAQEGLAVELILVSNRKDFLRAIGERSWDLILADYRLPPEVDEEADLP